MCKLIVSANFGVLFLYWRIDVCVCLFVGGVWGDGVMGQLKAPVLPVQGGAKADPLGQQPGELPSVWAARVMKAAKDE